METTSTNYTEEQALALVSKFVAQFGWQTAIITNQDIATAWEEITGRQISAEILADVKDTRMWVRYLDEAMVREGMEYLYETLTVMADRVAK